MPSSPESLVGITPDVINFENKHISDTVIYDFEVADYGLIVEEEIRSRQFSLHSFIYNGPLLPANIDMESYKAGVAYAYNLIPRETTNRQIPDWLLIEIQKKIMQNATTSNGRMYVDMHWYTKKLEQSEHHLHQIVKRDGETFDDFFGSLAFKLGVVYGSMPFCLEAQTMAFPDDLTSENA